MSDATTQPHLLDVDTVLGYLIRVGLVPERAESQLAVDDLTGRNRCFAVHAPHMDGFFVKQAAFRDDRRAVAREGVVRAHLERAAPPPVMEPRLRMYDDAHGVLVADLILHAQTLRGHQIDSGCVSPQLASALGRLLAEVHSVPATALPPTHPWVMSADRPGPDVLREASSGNLRLLTIVQQSDSLRAGIERMRRTWQPSALLHGDARWDNVLVPAAGPSRRVYLIDWERAGLGDPKLDVGAALAEYLWWWLDSMRLSGAPDVFHAAASARFPLVEMQPAVASFWSAYVKRRALRAETADAFLAKAMLFAAGRLIEGAFERTAESSHLDARVLLALQLAANVTDAPREAARDLFAL